MGWMASPSTATTFPALEVTTAPQPQPQKQQIVVVSVPTLGPTSAYALGSPPPSQREGPVSM
jgi:hypothetical protein